MWEERREGDRSLRKQLSLSWEPQGPLNFLCFSPPGRKGGGSSLHAVLRKVYFELWLWEAGYRKEPHPACFAPPSMGYSGPSLESGPLATATTHSWCLTGSESDRGLD